MIEHYLIPLAPYALMVAGILVCLLVFLSLKREIQDIKAKARRGQEGWERASEELSRRLDEVTERLREAEERAGLLVAPAPPRSGLNLAKRTQAMRMYRQGKDPRAVAATLDLPRADVELLMKVQKIVLDAAATS
jgi:hypothetical protein